MGMADQYDDGRYDSRDTYGHVVLPRMAATSIGFVPITAPSGGIKYPHRKAHTMALTPKQKVRKLEAELDSNLTLRKVLEQEEARLRAEIKRADVPPPPPSSAGDMFRVIVRFSDGGPNYTYLLARSGDRWYTTGTSPDQKVFSSWEKLCGWINSTAWHSHVERLQVTGKGHWITEHTEDVRF